MNNTNCKNTFNENQKIFAANWKMAVNKSDLNSFATIAKDFSKKLKNKGSNHRIMITPSACFLNEFSNLISQNLSTTISSNSSTSEVCNSTNFDNISIGAQNIHWEKLGAFTGELSADMIKDCGCTYAIIGHSERRNLFLESDEVCVKRAISALKQGLEVVYCIGESLEERKASLTNSISEKQLSILFSATEEKELFKKLIIAYEPIWAIGTGLTATTSEINDAHSFINDFVSNSLGFRLPILYGGSVSPANWQEILTVPNVAGGLVGGASQKIESFTKLLEGLL